MALFSMKEMLQRAKDEKYAIGYFESWNLESVKAVINAAEEMNSPVIIGFNGGILTNPKRIIRPENLEYYASIGKIAAKNTQVPVALILNEVTDLELVESGIELGFNAVMFECESDDLDKDISLTRKIVEIAHGAGVTVESNVGRLPTADKAGLRRERASRFMTTPEDAKKFVEETGIDALGVSIGNVEVLMEGKATMRFDLLEKIHEAVDIPITLHGGSGIADEDVKRLVELGLCKMNIGAALNKAFLDGMEKVKKSNTQYVSPKYRIGSGLKQDIVAGGEIAMRELVKYKMKIYGSAGKAKNKII